MYLCAIGGVDGSGKSTFARSLSEGLRAELPDASLTQLWLRYSPRESRTQTVSSTVSAGHRGHPAKRLMRKSALSGSWVRANAAVYRRQLTWQLAAAHQLDVVIADRFVLDFLADQVAAGMLPLSRVAAVATSLPTADLLVHLDADDATLVSRLKDGDVAEKVLAQARTYRELADQLSLRTIDGRSSADMAWMTQEVLRGLHG